MSENDSITARTGESNLPFTRRTFLTGSAGLGLGVAVEATADISECPSTERIQWDREVDIVVVGAGAAGLPAAIAARDHGASVLLLEQNYDIGGNMMLSGGNVHLGGGNLVQRQNDVKDSEEQVFLDFIQRDNPQTRYNDRELVRAFAYANLATFEFLTDNGVVWDGILRSARGASSVLRRPIAREWPNVSEVIARGARGSGLARPLERSARRKGVEILLQHRMTKIFRENPTSGRAVGVAAVEVDRHFKPTSRVINIRARRGIIVGTGGHAANVEFRRIFDPRLTEEYQAYGQGWAPANGDGEIASLAIGASLWGTANQTNESDGQVEKGRLAKRFNGGPTFTPDVSSNFFREGAVGLAVSDWQNLIQVKENGKRFYNEAVPSRNYDYYAAAMEWTGDVNKLNGGGPIWSIFDAEGAAREKWRLTPPYVEANFFFYADTVDELANKVSSNPYQWRAMPGAALRQTVERYNSFVDLGVDTDFQKPRPVHKIATPPFYAAWSTPALHDCYVGLRINGNAQVLDLQGAVIPGLYAAGQAAGGFGQHGVARGFVFGRLAGIHAAMKG